MIGAYACQCNAAEFWLDFSAVRLPASAASTDTNSSTTAASTTTAAAALPPVLSVLQCIRDVAAAVSSSACESLVLSGLSQRCTAQLQACAPLHPTVHCCLATEALDDEIDAATTAAAAAASTAATAGPMSIAYVQNADTFAAADCSERTSTAGCPSSADLSISAALQHVQRAVEQATSSSGCSTVALFTRPFTHTHLFPDCLERALAFAAAGALWHRPAATGTTAASHYSSSRYDDDAADLMSSSGHSSTATKHKQQQQQQAQQQQAQQAALSTAAFEALLCEHVLLQPVTADDACRDLVHSVCKLLLPSADTGRVSSFSGGSISDLLFVMWSCHCNVKLGATLGNVLVDLSPSRRGELKALQYTLARAQSVTNSALAQIKGMLRVCTCTILCTLVRHVRLAVYCYQHQPELHAQ
jgi:hypothetical protein